MKLISWLNVTKPTFNKVHFRNYYGTFPDLQSKIDMLMHRRAIWDFERVGSWKSLITQTWSDTHCRKHIRAKPTAVIWLIVFPCEAHKYACVCTHSHTHAPLPGTEHISHVFGCVLTFFSSCVYISKVIAHYTCIYYTAVSCLHMHVCIVCACVLEWMCIIFLCMSAVPRMSVDIV